MARESAARARNKRRLASASDRRCGEHRRGEFGASGAAVRALARIRRDNRRIGSDIALEAQLIPSGDNRLTIKFTSFHNVESDC